MEIGIPTYNSGAASYSFRILKSDYVIEGIQYYEAGVEHIDLPASPVVAEAFVKEFLNKTKRYFTNPMQPEKVLRHLRHVVAKSELPKSQGWYSFQWRPTLFVVKAGDFALTWEVAAFKEALPVIPAEFSSSTTPRAQSPSSARTGGGSPSSAKTGGGSPSLAGTGRGSPSLAGTGRGSPTPEQTAQEVRKIQIHDSLIPVGDLPLSDLPPLFFGRDEVEVDPAREEVRRRIREARLKAQLAKLKAQRMEQKYYERYGQPAEDSEESSEFSSDSGEVEELSFERHSHA